MKVDIIENHDETYVDMDKLPPNEWYLFESASGYVLGHIWCGTPGYSIAEKLLYTISIFDGEAVTGPLKTSMLVCKFKSAKPIKSITIEV